MARPHHPASNKEKRAPRGADEEDECSEDEVRRPRRVGRGAGAGGRVPKKKRPAEDSSSSEPEPYKDDDDDDDEAPSVLSDREGRGNGRDCGRNGPKKRRDCGRNGPKKRGRGATDEGAVEAKNPSAATSTRPRTEDLPPAIRPSWHTLWLPLLYRWYACEPSPWLVDPPRLVAVLNSWVAKYAPEVPRLPGNPGEAKQEVLYRLSIFRLGDGWRAGFASAGVWALIALYEDRADHFASDGTRRKYAQYLLQDMRFIYGQAEGDNREEWSGVFGGEIIRRILCHHVDKIRQPSQEDLPLEGPDGLPFGALALAAAAAERALRLFDAGAIPIPAIRQAQKERSKTIRFVLNAHPEVTACASFSHASWGRITQSYLDSARRLSRREVEQVFRHASASLEPANRQARRSGSLAEDLLFLYYRGSDNGDPRASLTEGRCVAPHSDDPAARPARGWPPIPSDSSFTVGFSPPRRHSPERPVSPSPPLDLPPRGQSAFPPPSRPGRGLPKPTRLPLPAHQGPLWAPPPRGRQDEDPHWPHDEASTSDSSRPSAPR
ncbi:hypothetical protein C0991_010100, partial [Blastosporella zonata]